MLDQKGVGELIVIAKDRGRQARPDLKVRFLLDRNSVSLIQSLCCTQSFLEGRSNGVHYPV